MQEIDRLRKIVDAGVQNYLAEIKPEKESKGLIELHRAMGYSLTGGGARFRPILALLAAEALDSSDVGGKPTKAVAALPFALALEMVHTYSLIHDDLPAMDDDDFRRGRPANHKIFGESLAVLAGDALATEPYRYLVEKYSGVLAAELVKILAEAAGPRGMVGGQALDVLGDAATISDLEYLHRCKTVALFRAAVMGAAAIAGANADQKQALDGYASDIGLLFQVADDIADGADDAGPSFVKAVGLEKARKYCQNLRNSAIEKVPNFATLTSFADMIFERSTHASGKNK